MYWSVYQIILSASTVLQQFAKLSKMTLLLSEYSSHSYLSGIALHVGLPSLIDNFRMRNEEQLFLESLRFSIFTLKVQTTFPSAIGLGLPPGSLAIFCISGAS